ncbi:MFS transporter [Novosphingobium sp. JCM 18896]|uniref:MFS transporter n=1 Tax=Novosphingobium sp. JCM 18896 TaxID=2989731 RepID=UPI00222265C9|nr:MFS transporter [Novosphingobium sp. JCM 18896]MCW1431264.1 MFS transporter [Novosphingobium sp. JCM 18896]
MKQDAPRTALSEWRRHGVLPIAAGIGYSTMALQTYGVGPFVAPLEQTFGWSRSEVMLGLTISNTIGVLLNFAVGVLADRMGPRRVALGGVVLKASAIALLATATGTMFNWSLLWLVVAFGAVLAQANVWASAVASRFDKGRGLALAVTLSGSSFCAAIVPVLATWLIGAYGWRLAFVGVAAIWLAVALPVVFLFFYGRQDDERRDRKAAEVAAAELPPLPGVTIREGLRMPAFWQLMVAAFAFAFYTMSIAPNLVPLMSEKGQTALVAAQLAALMGMVGIVARISAGFLLDHFSATILGTAVFTLPVIGCGLMLIDVPGYLVLALAVASFGVTIGAEYDVVFYLVSRHFGLKSFASLMGALLTSGALGGAAAPLVAGWLHDRSGDYDQMLVLLMILMGSGAVAIATMGRPKHDWSLGH